MSTIYITDTGRLKINEDGSVSSIETQREAISNIMFLTEDTKIVFDRQKKKGSLEGKKGDLIISFYEPDFPHPVIVVNNQQWIENLDEYKKKLQARKEQWASESDAECKREG